MQVPLFPITPTSILDYLLAYGLLRASTLVASVAPVGSFDPYTLITGEDVSDFDLPSTDPSIDPNIDSDSGFAFITYLHTLASHLQSKCRYKLEVFGTATLTFVYTGFNTLIDLWVEPTDLDWLQWVPLPRLVLQDSYFHIFGLDYFQAFALFHTIPIWTALVFALI